MILIIIDKITNNSYVKNKLKKKFLDVLKLIGVGLIAGFINGFFGAGGGLLLVPMISYTQKDDAKTAHATTLVCVLFMCLTSSIFYFIKKQVDYKLLLCCLIGSIVGSIIGTRLLKKLKNNIIDLIFSFVLVLAGVLMIIF